MTCLRSLWTMALGVCVVLALPSLAEAQLCEGGGGPALWFSNGTSEYYRCDDARSFTVARNRCNVSPP